MASSNTDSEHKQLDDLLAKDDSEETDLMTDLMTDQDDDKELTAEDQDDSKEIDLLTDQEDQDDQGVTGTRGKLEKCNRSDEAGRGKSSIKLLLISRTPWFIIGLLILVTGIVLSQYRINLPYQPAAISCSDDLYNDTSMNDDNFTNSSTTHNNNNNTFTFYPVKIP